MGLKSYAELRDEEDASKRKRATLVSILKRVFNRRFCVLSAAALLAFCIFVAFNIQSNPAQSNPVVANNFMTKPSEFVETTVNSANHISGSCDQVLTDHDIDPKAFGPIVAHSIHSLSLDDLRFCKKHHIVVPCLCTLCTLNILTRHYFSPDASTTNMIPVVDLNLTSNTPVLEHAPSRFASPFKSLGMRVLDQVNLSF